MPIMSQTVRDRIKSAFSLLIRPIIRLAIRNGIVYREFADICRNNYVQVAFDEYGVGGRNTNTSRIALITGINRKDIKKIKDAIIDGSLENQAAPDRISRVLTGWHQDPNYLDDQGQPLLLPIESEDSVSFHSLVAEYGGDIAPVTLIKEFKRSQVVEEDLETGRLRILKRFYIPTPDAGSKQPLDFIAPKAMEHASSLLNDHATTIYHNLYRENTKIPARFERRATNFHVSADYIEDFHELVNEKAQQLLEEIDLWLSEHETSNPDDKKANRLGLGIYWIQGEESQLNDE